MSMPSVGQRFIIKGVEFEIAHISAEQLRYTSVAGGKQYSMATSKAQSLVSAGDLDLIGRTNTEDMQPDHLSKEEIKIMNYRKEYVQYIFLNAHHPGSKDKVEPLIAEVAKETKDENPPSFSTCLRWFNKYKRSNKNPLSLVPRYSNRGNRTFKFSSDIENLVQKHLSEEYLTNQRLSITAIHANIVGDIYDRDLEHLDIPSLSTITRRVRQIDPYLRSKTRNGKYQANRRYKSAGKSYVTTRILEAVEADGNLLDVLIVDPDTGEVMGRPYGTCLIDKYSRCILAFKITMIPFSAATLLDTLSTALSEGKEKFSGHFETLIVDNGSDFISHSVQNFCQNMGIRIEYGSPRDPNSKPHVERFFGTMNKQLIHMLPGTTFSNPVEKGEYKSEKYACLTLEKLQENIEKWLEIYHQGIHQGHGRAPEKLWEESLKDNPTVTFPKEHLDTIAREIEYRSIVKGRIRVHNLHWHSQALATLEQVLKNTKQSTEVEVYLDSLDLSKVFVRDPRDKKAMIQCDAVKPEYANGLSLYEHEQILSEIMTEGKDDLKTYGDHALQIKRWELWQDINADGKLFAKKKIARLKEVQKNQIVNKKRVKAVKKRAKDKIAAQSLAKSNKTEITKSHENPSDKTLNKSDCDIEPDYYEYERLNSAE